MEHEDYIGKVMADIQSAEDWLDEMTIEDITRRALQKPGLAAYRVAVRAIVERAYKRWKERNPLY